MRRALIGLSLNNGKTVTVTMMGDGGVTILDGDGKKLEGKDLKDPIEGIGDLVLLLADFANKHRELTGRKISAHRETEVVSGLAAK